MLKITLLDSAAELRFQLEGRLAGAWVNELRQCWTTAASTTAGRAAIVDLREVDFVDAPGELLLADMHRAGVRLEAITPLIRAVVQGICTGPCCARVEEKPQSHAVVCSDPPRTHSRAS
jgi:anti-anti-sigma regulatory factor